MTLATAMAVLLTLVGGVNLSLAVEWRQLSALESPDAWLPFTAALAGWLVLRLAPGNATGWLLLAIAASSAIFGAAALVVLEGPDVPVVVDGMAAWLGTWAFLPGYLGMFLLLPLLIPTGRLPTPQWRPALALSAGAVLVTSLLLAFGSSESLAAGVTNPAYSPTVGSLLEAADPAIWWTLPVLAVCGAASLGHRFRLARGRDRQAVAAFAATVALGIAAFLGTGQGVVLGLLLPLVVAGVVAQDIQGRLIEQLSLARVQADELVSSRARLAQAHDTARRRIERDLHDGAQQGLLAMAVELGRLRRKVDGEAAQAVTGLQELAAGTLADLRALAAGTYPSALRELGVAAALREALTRDVSLRGGWSHRPSEHVENALYFACLEAATNALKHAPGAPVTVTLDCDEDDVFRFTVTDGGGGFDVRRRGTGMDGMRDRLGAVGGHLRVSSGSRGTEVVGTVDVRTNQHHEAPR